MYSLVPFSKRDGNIFRYMDDIERSFFGNISGTDQFRCDISEKDGIYLLEAELPGFDKKDIHVDVDDDVITISASHNEESEKKDKDGNYIRRERRYGSFSRSFNAEGVDVDKVKAHYKNGVLSLSMPKAKETVPETRKIEIGS
ncbi:MAG: Hsp20/alpha crystallin family protein [Oscillospiraceae bacterium]